MIPFNDLRKTARPLIKVVIEAIDLRPFFNEGKQDQHLFHILFNGKIVKIGDLISPNSSEEYKNHYSGLVDNVMGVVNEPDYTSKIIDDNANYLEYNKQELSLLKNRFRIKSIVIEDNKKLVSKFTEVNDAGKIFDSTEIVIEFK